MFASTVCLALAIYWEARSEPIIGQLAVGQVVLNRVNSTRWPDSVCEVVKQNHKKHKLHACQFSFYCDGKSDNPRDLPAWRRAKALADIILNIPLTDHSKGSNHYHTKQVNPYWVSKMTQQITIGSHIFYSEGIN